MELFKHKDFSNVGMDFNFPSVDVILSWPHNIRLWTSWEKNALYKNDHTFTSSFPICIIHFSFISYFLIKAHKTIFVINSDNGHLSLVLALCI